MLTLACHPVKILTVIQGLSPDCLQAYDLARVPDHAGERFKPEQAPSRPRALAPARGVGSKNPLFLLRNHHLAGVRATGLRPGMYNDEALYYTNRIENLKVADGNLYIIARKENYGGRKYTSGRMDTEPKAWWTCGKFEIRARLPDGSGSWPAFWLLGHECGSHGGWPACGEIDIAEYAGWNPNVVNATAHMKDINHKLGNNPVGSQTLADVANNFHVYSVEWYEDQLDFYYDGVKVLTIKDPGNGAGSWPYFNPQYLILNEALGGYGGSIDDALFPKEFVIDYVRVYQQALATDLSLPVTRK